jgi:hypothetical protein
MSVSLMPVRAKVNFVPEGSLGIKSVRTTPPGISIWSCGGVAIKDINRVDLLVVLNTPAHDDGCGPVVGSKWRSILAFIRVGLSSRSPKTKTSLGSRGIDSTHYQDQV